MTPTLGFIKLLCLLCMPFITTIFHLGLGLRLGLCLRTYHKEHNGYARYRDNLRCSRSRERTQNKRGSGGICGSVLYSSVCTVGTWAYRMRKEEGRGIRGEGGEVI
ncbi:hypothetical protein EX30DRAFT_344752 [Ascodesmis nigricans]|uniref:Uncharacterized protein n=1 Tax=Ascodesmis nigricans TaxID=341454 RepID=A0A4S2MIG6_9PEZI|nr:hypothetical protein EX30DRAFT_344752 [Ascodesmis nigricans]